ncbi:MAG: hypothetical protein IPP76_07125 [Moraxellaceae bacterium]|nr:hypothetical protein [Moraxellaceae bacterium]
MTYINKIASLLCLIGMGLSLPADAADVSLTMRAEKEVPVTIQGITVPMLKPVRRINVGDVIVISLSYKNNEEQEAYNVNIDNPIPAGTRFMRGTGQGKGAVFWCLMMTVRRMKKMYAYTTRPSRMYDGVLRVSLLMHKAKSALSYK